MAFLVDKKGNITLIQGDSGTLKIKGLNTDKNYTICLGIKDKNRNTVGQELSLNSNFSDTVVFEFTPDFTDLLKVNKNELYAIYFYGIKVCSKSEQFEDTLLLGNSDIPSINTITVFPKKVEGM